MSSDPVAREGDGRPAAADDERWAEAQSILDRVPTAPAAQRLRRARRNRWLLVFGPTVIGMALAVVIMFLLRDGIATDEFTEVSTARAVAGFTLSGLGLLLAAVGLFWQFRAARRARAYGSPMYVLTRRQQKELLAQIRGRAPVQPERIALARNLAELLQVQQWGLVSPAGLLVNFVGLWIASLSTWRLITIGVFASGVLLGAVLLRRHFHQMRRFLATHPVSGMSA